jgi:hypothetical protein
MRHVWYVWVIALFVLNGCSQSTQGLSVLASSPIPAIFFTDVQTGPITGGPRNLGVPISIFGRGFGVTRGSSRVTIGGIEVASYLVWGQNNAHNTQLDMIVVQPGPNVTGGAIVVSVNNRTSNGQIFTVNTGKVYAIAKTGNDANTCLMASPCATLSHVATNIMQPGDTVLVRRGNYSESEIWQRKSGVLGNAMVIKNYPGEEVTLSNAARPFIVDADYITVSGFNFTNGKSLGIAGWAKRNQRGDRLINNTFKGIIAYDAIGSHGDNHLIAGNVCDVSGSNQGTQGHCYYISYGRNVRVLYNIGSGVPGYGIHVFDQCRELLANGGGCDTQRDFKRVISNLLIEGNILKDSTSRSGLILAMNDEGGLGNSIDNVTIRNNIFTANNHAGMRLFSISSNIKIYNNTFYQNGVLGIAIESADITGLDIQNNLIYQSPNSNCLENCQWYTPSHIQSVAPANAVNINNNSYHGTNTTIIGDSDANAITGAVQFINPAVLNFRVLAGSSMIDQGVTLTTVLKDFDGQRRPKGSAFDTGAFEFLP